MGKLRLLSRREIDAAKQRDRQREIDEGIKVASSVDNLRQLKAEEDQNFRQWRDKTVAAIQKEIDLKTVEDRNLTEAISKKRQELEAFFGPLDRQWALYKQEEMRSLQGSQRFASDERLILHAQIQEAKKREDEADILAKKLIGERQEVVSERVEAKKLSQEAKEVLAQARNNAQTIISTAELTKKNADMIMEEAAVREHELNNFKIKLSIFDEELKKRETAVIIKELEYYSPVKRL